MCKNWILYLFRCVNEHSRINQANTKILESNEKKGTASNLLQINRVLYTERNCPLQSWNYLYISNIRKTKTILCCSVVICAVLFLLCCTVVIFVVLLLFVLFYVFFVCKCVLYHCHRMFTQLQLTNISISVSKYGINYQVLLFTQLIHN